PGARRRYGRRAGRGAAPWRPAGRAGRLEPFRDGRRSDAAAHAGARARSRGPAARGVHPLLPAHRHAARAERGARVSDGHLHPRGARRDLAPQAPPLAVADGDRRRARAAAQLSRSGRARGRHALLPHDRQAGRQGAIVLRRAHPRRHDAGRGGGRARRVGLDGATAHQPRQPARRRAGAARSDAGPVRGQAGAGAGGPVVSRERDVRSRMSDDDVIVDVMADAARQIAFEDAGPGPTPAVWHRLQTRRARGSRPPWRGLLVVSAGAAAVLALVMVGRGVQRGRPLTYVVAAGAAEQDGYIRGGSDGSRVQFSDGTHVDLGHGARVSVLSRGPRGARLRVEEGEARFDVAHLPHAAWSVEAGPYVVYVTGTVFDVRWSGSDEVIEVRMRSGSVQVGGPMLPERVTL